MHQNIYQKLFEEIIEQTGEIGFVTRISHPIISVEGLPTIHPEELVIFESGELGQVFTINKESVEILALSGKPMPIGTRVSRMTKQVTIPLSRDIIGKTISSLGTYYSSGLPIEEKDEERTIHAAAPGISSRTKIIKPLITGVSIVDLLVPLGKGQRELVLGDRKTGKTNFLLQAMLTQAKEGTICIYAAIGKRKVEIKHVEKYIRDNEIADQTLIVASSASDPVGLIYLTPYTAMTIAEYFKDLGHDVLLILDDLSTHAKYYREISLVGQRFPGRSSYPGDIFYAHARLLERAGNFKTSSGDAVSITCLPVAETVEGNISGYIQTNLMSITDGHIYFD
ncbi:F0F1 ATP synthase subunit alpha, partial [candidate division WWE3 bacterium]|nr:F0F1 ATP synthase subunit alpha [candidate division WWE3 bacterium]